MLISIPLHCAARWEVSPLKCGQTYSTEFRTRYTKTSCFVYRVFRYIHDPKNLIHDTYTIILGLQFCIVVQQILITFSYNFAKFSQIFLQLYLKFLKMFLNFLNIFLISKNCQNFYSKLFKNL